MKIEIDDTGDLIRIKVRSHREIELTHTITSKKPGKTPHAQDDFILKQCIVTQIEDHPGTMHTCHSLCITLGIDKPKMITLLNELGNDNIIDIENNSESFNNYILVTDKPDVKKRILDILEERCDCYYSEFTALLSGVSNDIITEALNELVKAGNVEYNIQDLDMIYSVVKPADKILKQLNDHPGLIYRTDELKQILDLHTSNIGSVLQQLHQTDKINHVSQDGPDLWSAKNA